MMIVADSSYIAGGLLKDSSLFDDYIICSPDFGYYEVLNVVWKHQVLLKRIKESGPVLDMFFELISAERIRFMAISEKTSRSAYELAVKAKTPFYDAVFVALAGDLGVELKTFDKRQAELFAEMNKRTPA